MRMHLIGGARPESARLYALAGALMVGGPVWQALYASHYPFSRPEAIAVTLIAALLGAIGGILSRAVGGVVGGVGFGVLLFVFVDLQTDLHEVIFTWILAVGCLALSFAITAHRAAITALALGAFYVASLVRGPIAPVAAH